MTEEEKAAQVAKEEAEAKAKADAEAGSSQNNTEIEKALGEERKRRESAEAELEETRRKAKERIEKKRQEEKGDDDDAPVTRSGIRELLDEERVRVRKEMQTERAQEVARKLSESDSEAELVLEVWKNRTLGGTLDEQIEEAHAIATHKRTRAKNEELKRALAGKDGQETTGDNAQRKPFPKDAPDLQGNDKQVVAGMTWDNAKSAYRKLIAGGTKVYFVSKDLKKRWIEPAPKK